MLTRKEFEAAQIRAAELIRASGLVIRSDEAAKIEVADFGLSRLSVEGAQILTWVATDRMAVKIIALTPGQTLPEHWHPRVGDDPGKEETIRVAAGILYCYMDGEPNLRMAAIPDGKENFYTVRHELMMKAGDQITLAPGAKHWFQAGPDGAVVYSFSTVARDILDRFTDPAIERITKIKE